MPPRVVLEVLEGDLEEGPRVSPQGPPSPPRVHPPPTPTIVLTCQGQLWGRAFSPPTTRADRLGRKVGTPQLEAEADRRGRAQVRWAGTPLGKGRRKFGADTGSEFTVGLWGAT